MHTPTDPRKHVALQYVHDLRVPADQVFPLLCPVREYEWIDDWRCELVHTTSGVVEKGCIFVTESPSEGRTLWVTSVHDPAARRVEFVRVNLERLVTLMSLRVEPNGAGCRLHAGFTLVALDASGQAIVDAVRATGGPHAQIVLSLVRRLEHFLTTGRMLSPDPTRTAGSPGAARLTADPAPR
jgi:hypothetical protein